MKGKTLVILLALWFANILTFALVIEQPRCAASMACISPSPHPLPSTQYLVGLTVTFITLSAVERV